MDQRAPSFTKSDSPKSTRRRATRSKRWRLDRTPRKWRIAGAAIGGVILLAVLVWVIRPSGASKHADQEPPKPIGIAKVTTGDIAIQLNALGTVTPLATVTIKSQVSGTLSAINFTEGQTVQAGDVLAQIDPRPYQAVLDQAKGQLARDQAQLANARVDLGRYKTLVAQSSISQQQYDTQAALVGQDEGIVKSDQGLVEAAAINLDYTHIVSPVAGRVGLRQVDLGNLVQAQSTNIVVVTQLQPISVLFAISEDNIGDITARLNQGATLTTAAYDRAWTHQITAGKLATLDNEIDVTTGTVKLRAMFDNADSTLFPNQFVNIRLLVDTKHDQIIVPTAAIQRGASGTYVFVVNPDNTVKMTTVELGPVDGEKQAVAKGLQADQTVVTDGADGLRDGTHVQPPNQDGQQPTAQKPAAPPEPSDQAKDDKSAQGQQSRHGGRSGQSGKQ